LAAHGYPDHGLCSESRPRIVTFANPQIKEIPSSEAPFLDETFEGFLPADPLLRAEPLLGLQRLNLGQLFPARFPAARKDFPSSGSPRAGKKAVLITTFSFGWLVCSFHEARIIVKFFCNIQRFVLNEEKIPVFSFVWFFFNIFLHMDKKFFCCTIRSLSCGVRSFFWGTNVYFGRFSAVEKMLISY